MSTDKFRKKPVVIEAMQYDGTVGSASRVCQWINSFGIPEDMDEFVASYTSFTSEPGAVANLAIFTLEGPHQASAGDWIIKGVAGEFYPCKPEIFAATYEPADSSPRYEFDGPALNIAQKIMECRATAAIDGWPDDRLKAAIQCLVIEAMKWAAPAAPAVHPLLSRVEQPHRRVIYVIEDENRGDLLFTDDLESAVLEQFAATKEASEKYLFGAIRSDGRYMTADDLADEQRLLANPFKASNGVTVTWINANQLPPAAPEGWKLVPAELTQEMAVAAAPHHDVKEYYRALLAAAPAPGGDDA
jgi:hypothetical protein